MEKQIVGFHVDEQGDWVADLECGHRQHVRHNPPWINRPWVLDEAGRQQALGNVLNCLKCNMPRIPNIAKRIDCSEAFDHQMLKSHYSGICENNSEFWIQVVVSEGELVYQRIAESTQGYVIEPDFFAVIEPGIRYSITAKGIVRGRFDYYQMNP